MALDISAISDTQSESGVIATLMYHPEFILHTEYLKAKYFYNVENSCLYWAVEQLYKSGIDTIDALNITNMLNSNKAVKKKIEEYNLTDIQEFINLAQYAARHTLEEYKLLVNNVVTMSFKRDLNKLAHEIQSYCFNDDTDLNKLNTLINDKISNLTEQYLITEDIENFGSHVDDLWEEIVSRRNEDGLYGIPSKFPSLANYFSFETGELVLLKARMKRGKSAIFLNEAIHKLVNGVPTVIFDTEMQDRLFLERMISNLTGIEVKRIKTGKYTKDEETRIVQARQWIKEQPFCHIYMPNASDEEVYAMCKILKYKMDLQFVIYDYIKSNVQSTSENYNILGAKTDFLKNQIAGKLDLAVFAGAQLNRQMEVADSDKISRYVSTSILWREKSKEELAKDGLDCGNFALNVDLNRNGSMMEEDDYLDMLFNGDKMQITEAKKHIPAETTPFQ